MDLSEFRLQYCYGSVKQVSLSSEGDDNESDDSKTFQDAYQGPLTSVVVRHLRPSASYTFRVCGRAEGAHAWSPWSVPCVAMTSIPPYGECWVSGILCGE